ncbi:CHAT domain-containing protein [Kitasatospora purpeofusca]|uniref:CHAT domain-containing protein n=1 Tax=Kitasatospora purpeofusca TaxID=67352 RepID=UPI0004C2185C|nr:CHAT domain-containing protein [Kitasatospora purpeofusca]
MRDHLNQLRNSWTDELAASVCRKLAPETDHADLLVAWVTEDPLTLAGLLSRIATRDITANSPVTISAEIADSGLTAAGVSVSRVARELVMPVLHRFRWSGAPWDHWWDIQRLNIALLELWTGRRLSTRPKGEVLREMMMIWDLQREPPDDIMENSTRPFDFLPPNFFDEPGAETATQPMKILVSTGYYRLESEEDIIRDLPALTDRPDLQEMVRRHRRRNTLKHLARQDISIPVEIREKLESDLSRWDAQNTEMLLKLTAHELELITPLPDDKQYGHRCLMEMATFTRAWLLPEDALLWEPAFHDPAEPAPHWIAEEIVTCGARSFHTNAGPHPLWLATIETNEHLEAVERLMAPGSRNAMGIEYEDGEVRLQLILPTVGSDSPPRVPYTYSLSFVEHAWELLHLATVGYVRLCIARLIDDGEVRPFGAITIFLPAEVIPRIHAEAVVALRRMIGEETSTIRNRIAFEGLDEQSEAAFYSCENAKAEDLHDELLWHQDDAMLTKFIESSRRLARARSRRASSILDRQDEFLDNYANEESLVEDRQRALENLRGARKLDTGDRADSSQGVRSIEDRTMFVHLANRFGFLHVIASWHRQGESHFEILSSGELPIERLVDATQEWVDARETDTESTRHERLNQILSPCTTAAVSIAATAAANNLTHLALSPTAPLDLIPLHSVPLDSTGTSTLVDAFEQLTYIPTERLLSAIRRTPRPGATSKILVVAHSGAGVPGMAPIDGPRAEARLISALHRDVEIVQEEAATPERALQSMTHARIVHVSSHGLTHQNRWAAGLVLHGASIGEATLTTSRILADGAFTGVDLVILNACRTGAHEGSATAVQTLRTIESAFLARGTRAVVSTLWEITDLLGVVFSTALHALLASGAAPGAAFRDTIRYLRSGDWHAHAREEPLRSAESLLSELHREWRRDLDREATQNPLFWATFRITGAV